MKTTILAILATVVSVVTLQAQNRPVRMQTTTTKLPQSPTQTAPPPAVTKSTTTASQSTMSTNVGKLNGLTTSYSYQTNGITAKIDGPTNVTQRIKQNKVSEQVKSSNTTSERTGASGSKRIRCGVVTKNLSFNQDNFDVLDDKVVSHFYPGAVMDLASIQNGTFVPVENGKKPMNLLVNAQTVTGNASSMQVQDPNKFNTIGAVQTLLNRSATGIPQSSEEVYIYEVYSESDFNLKLSMSASASFGSVKNIFNFNTSSRTRKVLIDYKIGMFSILAAPANGTLFADNAMNTKSSLTYVDQVQYGARLLVGVEMEEVSTDMQNQLNAKYTGSFNAALDLLIAEKNKNKITTMRSFAWGLKPGSSLDALHEVTNVISFANLAKTIKSSFTSNYPSQWGKPIGYSLKFLDGKVAVANAKLDNLPQRTCQTEIYGWRITLKGLNCLKQDDGNGDEIHGNITITGFNSDGSRIGDRLNRRPDVSWGVTSFNSGDFKSVLQLEQVLMFRDDDLDARVHISCQIFDDEDFGGSDKSRVMTRDIYLRDLLNGAYKEGSLPKLYGGFNVFELNPASGRYQLVIGIEPILD